MGAITSGETHIAYQVAGSRGAPPMVLLHALGQRGACPPFRREHAVRERPAGPLEFDWAVAPAIIGQVNAGDPAAWDGLGGITASTLLIGGGPQSHIPQDKLTFAAACIPHCRLITIPAGHHVHAACPSAFTEAVLNWTNS